MLSCRTIGLAFTVILGCDVAANGEAESEGGAAMELYGLAELEAKISEFTSMIDAAPSIALAALPPSRPGYWLDSSLIKDGYDACWIQVDLGASVSPDLIAFVPQFLESGKPSAFPAHFQVTLSNEADGEGGKTILDSATSSFSNEKNKFVLIEGNSSQEGRYLRITPSYFGETNPRTARDPAAIRCALSEIFVFVGEHNVALGAPVSTSVKEVPGGSQRLSSLTDGWSPIGAPEDPTTASRWEGYHSYHSGGKSTPDSPYWIQIDLGQERPLDQVNLIPVTPASFPEKAGYGFPVRFKIEASSDKNFANRTLIFDSQTDNFPVPSSHHLSFSGSGQMARYVRLTVYDLFRGGWNSRFFAVAEMQVISGGGNVSEGMPTRAFRSLDELYYPRIKDEIEASTDDELVGKWKSWSAEQRHEAVRDRYNERFFKGGFLVWGEPALVDGFSSSYRLLPFPEYLRKVYQGEGNKYYLKQLKEAKDSLLARQARISTTLLYIGLLIGAMILIVSLWLSWRFNETKRKEIRAQLARDLHDDLSSEICNIALIAQQIEASGTVKKDADSNRLRILAESSRNTVGSLRDLIFLTNLDAQTWANAAAHLRRIPETLFGPLNISYHFSADTPTALVECSEPRKLRNIILIYKEALHNVCKHSKASHVEIDVTVLCNELTIRITDNGRGVQKDAGNCSGLGMRFMQIRAEEVGGRVSLEDAENTGTRVIIETPL